MVERRPVLDAISHVVLLLGVPAVLLAAFVVKNLDIVVLRWGVVVVGLYAAFLLLRSAFRGTRVLAGESA